MTIRWCCFLNSFLSRGICIARGSVIHSYSGPVELVDELQRHGLSLSFSGSVTYPRNKRVREAVKRVSREFLLLETDSPDIAPEEHFGNNEPCTLIDVANAVAHLRGIGVEDVARDSFAAACGIFGVVQEA